MVSKCGTSYRNLIIVSLSLSVGLGFTQTQGLFDIFPPVIRSVFAENCVAVTFLMAVVMNLILPKETEKRRIRTNNEKADLKRSALSGAGEN